MDGDPLLVHSIPQACTPLKVYGMECICAPCDVLGNVEQVMAVLLATHVVQCFKNSKTSILHCNNCKTIVVHSIHRKLCTAKRIDSSACVPYHVSSHVVDT